jgi:hypothetical protein
MADQLVTTAQVKARLKITAATFDALIIELIEQLTDFVQHRTGRQLVAAAAVTYTLDTTWGSVLAIPRGIRAVTSLSVASTDQPDTGGAYTAVAAADILLRPGPILRRPGWPATEIRLLGSPIDRRVPFRSAANGAVVVGDFGFATVPPAMQGLAIDAVVTAYVDRRAGTSGGVGAGDRAVYPWSTYFASGSPQAQLLADYRGGPGIG